MKQSINIIANFYKPGFLAGGPIKSITNLVKVLDKDFVIRIYTQNFDLGSTGVYDVPTNVAIKEESHFIFYFSKLSFLFKLICFPLKGGEVIYLNSLFSASTIVFIIFNFLRVKNRDCLVVIAPRGELDRGALNIKRKKKYLFLFFFKKVLNIIRNNLKFHATTSSESHSIDTQFPNYVIEIAENIPSKVDSLNLKRKEKGSIDLLFLSRIVHKKNLKFALRVLKDIKAAEVRLNIFGPIEDREYWKLCLRIIEDLPSNIEVNYRGTYKPSELGLILSDNHVLFFPTLGENYGHVIFEAISHGLPVLISDQTPWNSPKNGIFSINLEESEKFVLKIEEMSTWNNESYKSLGQKVYSYAGSVVDLEIIKYSYKELFNNVKK